jgi:hypothetical protein
MDRKNDARFYCGGTAGNFVEGACFLSSHSYE